MSFETAITRLGAARAAALRAADRLAFAAPLATRVVVGLTFMHTGWGKLHNFARTAEFFASLGIPFPTANAALVSALELVGGVALIAGLGTRLFAAALSASMAVALLTADRQAFLTSWSAASDTTPTDVASFTMLLFLLWLVFLGPGKASLDRVVLRLTRERHADASRPAVTGAGTPAKQE